MVKKKLYRQIEVGDHDHYPIHAWWYMLTHGRMYDVVVEDVSKIPLFVPCKRKLTLVHHLNRRIYFEELDKIRAALGYFLETLMPRLYTKLFRMSRFVTVSNYSKSEIVRLGASISDVSVIDEGIASDSANETIIQKTPFPSLCFVSRLVKYKRPEHVLYAFANVLHVFPSSKLYVIGEGESRNSLIRIVSKLSIDQSVVFLGRTSDQKRDEILKSSWLNIVTSEKEGWCLVVSEAARYMTPTIAYRNSGLQESIIEDKTGILVEDGNIDSLAKAIIGLLSDKQTLSILATNAKENTRTLRWESTVEQLKALIQSRSS